MRVKRLSAFIAIFLIISTLFAFTACDGKSSTVQGIELDRGSVTLNVGDSTQLNMFVFPDGATGNGSWLSSDESVATVDNTGLVTGVSAGEAKIRVSLSGQKAECMVTVIDPSQMTVMVQSITLNAQRVELQLGAGNKNTYQLEANVFPANATDKSLTWSSADDRIATVDDNGLVTAVSSGTVAVGCVASNSVSARCVVVVKNEDGSLDDNGGISNDPLYIGKVPSLSTRSEDHPFIMAMDASEVLTIENARKANGEPLFKNFDGEEQDVFEIMADNGITDIRVRVWNDPKTASGAYYGGGNCDIDNAVEIARRCKDAGLGIIVDFHYSDFWADPGKQRLPKSWENLSTSQIEQEIYKFTKESLEKIQETDVKITMVQIGNETTSSFCGTSNWTQIYKYFNQGSKAVRDVTGAVAEGGAKVALHFTNAGDMDYVSKAKDLKANNVDYDVFGTSWYPYYKSHGSLSNLTKKLKQVHDDCGKEVMVLETAYAFTYEDFDGLGNTALETTTQPVTVQGMSNAVRDVIKAIADLGDWGLGVAYWGGTWIAASTSTRGQDNQSLCAQYGCGWATANAAEYKNGTNEVANNGGSQVDNNAFWLSDGTPLQSLKVFKMVYEGQTRDLAADFIEDQEIYYTVNEGPIVLPTEVSVVLNNGDSVSNLQAVWNCTDAELAEYITKAGMYDITGTTAFGGEAHVYVWVMYPNLLNGGSFEASEGFTGYPDGTIEFIQPALGDWRLNYTKATDDLQLYVSTNTGNARIGTQSFHFWDSGNVEFDLYQQIDMSKLTDYGWGDYGCSFDIQGGDGSDTHIYAYITVTYNDGKPDKTVKGDEVLMQGWQNWVRTSASVEIDATVATITVGIHVTAKTINNGPWGNIDNAQFFFEG